MANLPTPEDSARSILAIFKEHNPRPGSALANHQLQLSFTVQFGTPDEYLAGLKHGGDVGRFTPSSRQTVVLTDAGFAAM